MIPKVLAYITRHGPAGLEVLAFRYADQPEAPPQVSGGKVEDGEDLIQARWREIDEEPGLTGLSLVSQVAKARFFAGWRNEWQERTRLVRCA